LANEKHSFIAEKQSFCGTGHFVVHCKQEHFHSPKENSHFLEKPSPKKYTKSQLTASVGHALKATPTMLNI
jgi:hypothetical protein